MANTYLSHTVKRRVVFSFLFSLSFLAAGLERCSAGRHGKQRNEGAKEGRKEGGREGGKEGRKKKGKKEGP